MRTPTLTDESLQIREQERKDKKAVVAKYHAQKRKSELMGELGVVNPLNLYAAMERNEQRRAKRSKPAADNLEEKINQIRQEKINAEKARLLEELEWKLQEEVELRFGRQQSRKGEYKMPSYKRLAPYEMICYPPHGPEWKKFQRQMITCNKLRVKEEEKARRPENIEKAFQAKVSEIRKKPMEHWFDYTFTTPNIYGLDFRREWESLRKLAKEILARADELKLNERKGEKACVAEWLKKTYDCWYHRQSSVFADFLDELQGKERLPHERALR